MHYIQDRYIHPDLVVDISAYMDRKLEAIRAFKSQFHDPDSREPDTYISSPEFFEGIRARARERARARLRSRLRSSQCHQMQKNIMASHSAHPQSADTSPDRYPLPLKKAAHRMCR